MHLSNFAFVKGKHAAMVLWTDETKSITLSNHTCLTQTPISLIPPWPPSQIHKVIKTTTSLTSVTQSPEEDTALSDMTRISFLPPPSLLQARLMWGEAYWLWTPHTETSQALCSKLSKVKSKSILFIFHRVVKCYRPRPQYNHTDSQPTCHVIPKHAVVSRQRHQYLSQSFFFFLNSLLPQFFIWLFLALYSSLFLLVFFPLWGDTSEKWSKQWLSEPKWHREVETSIRVLLLWQDSVLLMRKCKL